MTYLIKKDNKTFEKYSFFDFMMLSTLCVLIFKTPEKSNDSWYLPNGKSYLVSSQTLFTVFIARGVFRGHSNI